MIPSIKLHLPSDRHLPSRFCCHLYQSRLPMPFAHSLQVSLIPCDQLPRTFSWYLHLVWTTEKPLGQCILYHCLATPDPWGKHILGLEVWKGIDDCSHHYYQHKHWFLKEHSFHKLLYISQVLFIQIIIWAVSYLSKTCSIWFQLGLMSGCTYAQSDQCFCYHKQSQGEPNISEQRITRLQEDIGWSESSSANTYLVV